MQEDYTCGIGLVTVLVELEQYLYQVKVAPCGKMLLT
jgi:hypothetical protein